MVKPFRFVPPTMALLAVLAFATCTGARRAGSGRRPAYPPRPPTCALTLFRGAAPPTSTWDDLGVAEVTCHLDVGVGQCLQRFRAEACRMGGDIVYGLPAEPGRPREQAIMYRGRVAHTRPPRPAATYATDGPTPDVSSGAPDPSSGN